MTPVPLRAQDASIGLSRSLCPETDGVFVPVWPFGITGPYGSTHWYLTCTTTFFSRHVYCQIGRSPKAKERGQGTDGIGWACNDLNLSLDL